MLSQMGKFQMTMAINKSGNYNTIIKFCGAFFCQGTVCIFYTDYCSVILSCYDWSFKRATGVSNDVLSRKAFHTGDELYVIEMFSILIWFSGTGEVQSKL